MRKALSKNYKRYQKVAKGKKTTLGFLRSFKNEIIFRTAKLEGEPVTRKLIKSIFG